LLAPATEVNSWTDARFIAIDAVAELLAGVAALPPGPRAGAAVDNEKPLSSSLVTVVAVPLLSPAVPLGRTR
jgi:hypothetical protein